MHRDAERPLQRPDLAAHLDAQLGVEIGERLVEQQHVRPITTARAIATRCSCPPESWCGQRGAKSSSCTSLRACATRRLISSPAILAGPQSVGDVVADREVGKHRIVLEHHAGVAPVRRQRVDALGAEQDAAAVERAEPRHHAQERSLAAAGRPQQREELAVADRRATHRRRRARCRTCARHPRS